MTLFHHTFLMLLLFKKQISRLISQGTVGSPLDLLILYLPTEGRLLM